MKYKDHKIIDEEYINFIKKFETKATTDDCYTPEPVYNAILRWVKENADIDISKLNIMRPFYPGGNYEFEKYTDNDVVIDNPPFSIVSKIVDFYERNKIKFFLFCNGITCFCIKKASTHIIANENIIYHNGANVNTAYVSNIFGEKKIIASYELKEAIKEANKLIQEEKKTLPKYKYPDELLTVSRLQNIINKGVSVSISSNRLYRITKLKSQEPLKKGIFGSGFLLSTKANKELKALELKAMELKAMEDKEELICWGISQYERDIIDKLDKGG